MKIRVDVHEKLYQTWK